MNKRKELEYRKPLEVYYGTYWNPFGPHVGNGELGLRLL